MPVLHETMRLSGQALALKLDAKRVKNWDEWQALVGRRRLLSDWRIRQLMRDRIILSWSRQKNLIVNAGLTALANELTAGTAFQLTYCGVGSGTNAAALTDTDLQTSIARVAVTAGYSISPNLAVWDTFFGTTAGNGTWNESGLFTASVAGTMGSRALFSPSFTKASTNTAVVEWKWTL